MDAVNYAIIGRKVCSLYPFLAKELIVSPELSDLKKIDELHNEFESISKGNCIHHRLIFIAAIIKLYDPDYLTLKTNIKSGLRKELSKCLGCKPTVISDNFKTVVNYMDIYPEFRNEVSYVYAELKKTCGVE